MSALILASIGQAVALDAMPVHAPAAPMRRGAPVQILRIGPVYDQGTGELVIDVTDELCAELASATSLSGFAVPIDHGHELYQRQAAGKPHADVGLYGRAAALDHRPGLGLWAVPEWNDAGAGYLAANPGTLFVSPTIQPAGFDPRTGKAVPGRVLHSLSITPTPRQNSLDSLALSRAATGVPAPKEKPMPGTEGGGQIPPNDAVTLAAKLAKAEAETVDLATKVAELERVAAAKSAEVVTLASQLNAKNADVTTLAQDVAKLQADAKAAADALKARDAEGEIRAAEVAGAVVKAELRPMLLSMDAPTRAAMLASFERRPGAVALGHGVVTEAKDPESAEVVLMAVAIAKDKKIPYSDAMKLAMGGGAP